MNNIKEFIKQTLYDTAYSCHKKNYDEDFTQEIKKMEILYPFIKEQLQNVEEDISLFRYKKLDLYAKKEVKKQKIFMNIPSNFDDLFDSNFVYDISEIDSSYPPYLHAIYCSKLTDENKLTSPKTPPTNGWDDFFKNINKDIDKLIRISSLSEDYKNIPLWYYYADKYSGICIEYSLKEILKHLKENEYIMPVIYTDNYFKYNPAITYTIKEKKMSIQSNALIKHDDWEFENEWRIIQISTEDSKALTDIIPIKSVTFGLHTKNKKKFQLMKLNQNIEFYELQRTCYGLKRIKITEKALKDRIREEKSHPKKKSRKKGTESESLLRKFFSK